MATKEKFEEAKRLYETANADQRYVLESLFPELKESEDEKIRKFLITFFINDYGKNSNALFAGIKVKDIIAWLEKQGEQKPPEYTLEQAAGIFLDALSNTSYNNKPITDAQVITKELLKFLSDARSYNPNAINEQKLAWSEEDEAHIDSLLKRLEGMCKPDATFTSTGFAISEDEDWLKSLKDKVQPKQEWSEDDERMCKAIIDNIKVICEEGYFVGNIDSNKLIDWLKSLRHLLQWKPSDEQIKALETTLYTNMSRNDKRYSVLSEFVAELKKLREE